MAEIQEVPTSITLHRFRVDPTQISSNINAWRLDFPYYDVCKKIAQDIADYLDEDDISVPYRVLNNILVSLAPLGHGFEYVNQARYALTITTARETDLPNPQRLHTVIFQWMLWWINNHTDGDDAKKFELETLWRNEATKMPTNWQWRPISVRDLFESFEPGNSLNYNALPSVLATLMHDTVTTVYGHHQIRWRKVQDGESKISSLVGFADNRPIHATYEIQQRRGRPKSGDGYFSFKLEFSLETQAGSTKPWLFLSLHAQRYAHETLNLRRVGSQRIALLVGPNRFRLDNSPLNATLLKLRVERQNERIEWSDYPSALLQAVGLSELTDPGNIFTAPQNYWHPIISNEHDRDEFYLIHDEGYRYGERPGKGHDLAAGLSLADLYEVTQAVVTQLPMLVPDQSLTPDANDQLMPQRWTDRPQALHNFRRYANSNSKTIHSNYPKLISESLKRAQQGKSVTITIFWHTEHTRIGLQKALHDILMIEEGKFPANVFIKERQIKQRELLSAFEYKGYKSQHQMRVEQWREFITSQPELNGNFALVELLRDERNKTRAATRTRSVIRHAFSQESIATQFILPLSMKPDEINSKQLSFVQNGSEHRANSAVHDLLLRQTGMLYGVPTPVYKLAGMEQSADLIGIYLEKNQNGLRFPMAAKLTMEGYFEAQFPKEKEWMPYSEAGPHLGRLFADEWNTLYWNRAKRRWNLAPHSKLNLSDTELIQFIHHILKSAKRPSIIVIEAENWRNKGIWPQLRNPDLGKNNINLDFGDILFDRNDTEHDNVLAIIRMKSGQETPQYTTDTNRDFPRLSGYYDDTNLFHYYSIGERLQTASAQWKSILVERSSMFGDRAPGIAYKHPQIIEFVPFFVHPDYDPLTLCRIPHLFRHAPAYEHGNIVYPYPMHLAKALIEDQLCILAMDD